MNAGEMDTTESSRHDSKWDQSLDEELANSVSNGLGLFAASIGEPMLLVATWRRDDRYVFIGTAVSIATMLLVYLGSTLYHAWPRGPIKPHVLAVFACLSA
jgi:hemolysin III